jgi:aminoglycoside phosphotransferase (APT) family kinase protein
MNLPSEDARPLIAALRRMALVPAGDTPRLTPLAGGVSSLIVRVDVGDRTLCIKRALPRLKVAAEWLAPVARNAAEVAWLRFAAGIAPHCVPRILGEDADTRSFAMSYLDPAAHPVWKSLLRDGVALTDTARAVAAVLVAIHAAAAREPAMATRFANARSFHALRLEPYFEASARAHPDCAPALQRLVTSTATAGITLMHGDISPKNILIGPQGPIFLDAECACWGDPAFDLAFCANHLLLKCLWRPAHRAAYLQCFDALAATYLAGVDWEPPAGLERRAAALLAGLLLARVDGKSPVEYLTEPAERERVRRIGRHFLLTPTERLATIRDHWEAHA